MRSATTPLAIQTRESSRTARASSASDGSAAASTAAMPGSATRLRFRALASFEAAGTAEGMSARALAVVLSLAMPGCGESERPASPTASTTATARLVFMGSTTRRTDLPASAEACLNGVGATHTHPSWRSFAGIPLQAVPPDRYEITFTDVPVNTRVSFRVNDQNACDENPTGAVTRSIFVNNTRLIQNARSEERRVGTERREWYGEGAV